MDYNRVILTGRLTRDPEMRYTGGGTAIVEFSIASNSRRQGEGGQATEETSFFDIIVFGKIAETCKKYLTKGRAVLVEGRLRQRRWESDDGQKHRKIEVIANMVQFLGSAQRGDKATEEPVEEIPPVDDSGEDVPF